ncbi:GyrI-like domain-containing protein [Reyranella sp. CPCC 100927]|uniref:AraC family transcriptional regulator n=1 Tax=Reyranella sp. CPCC 100927 TaxID=2599616 RepID=UPI0011B3968B|nr:AraC family transcriptional regulator [Reyranella sp. CPCC 100927]TWT02669.1 AraC family transcriptional regulator [Reyranella sp. CPCC 100927]
MNKPTTRHSYADRVARVATYIACHLDDSLELERLAAVACFSPSHFHRIYSALTGETVADTVRRCRLQRAATQLISTQQSIAAIARAAGYGSTAAFVRAFAVAHGVPPGVYRQRRQQRDRGTTGFDTGERNMTYPVSIEMLPPRRLLASRHVGSYDGLDSAFARLSAWAAARRLATVSSVAIYLNDCFDVPVDSLLTDVCLEVPDDTKGEGDVRATGLVGGRHAVLHHQGPYAELGTAYRWLYAEWLPKSGEEIADRPAFDVYLNDPRLLPPAQWRTDLCLPLVER